MSSLFFSYSHKDEALRDRLEVHLTALKREGAISTWHDRRIAVGDVLDQRIDEHLNGADVILLLVSPDFIASNYCYDVEMQRAMQRHAEGSVRVIPVILRPCDWHGTPFGPLLAAPTDGRPITKWPNEDEAFLDVVSRIRAALPAMNRAASTHVQQSPPQVLATAQRSSNLRLRKQFNDSDRDRFLDDAFEYMERFFENSLTELGARNDGIEGRFKKLDATRFSAVLYQAGKARSHCTIVLGGSHGRGISYSNRSDGMGNSYNEMLTIENDDQHLFLRPSGMTTMGLRGKGEFNFEGAAEHFWSLLIAPLQT